MGLDMYAGTLNRQPEKPVDFTPKNGAPLHYWRKHPDLHGWMESLYREKGGVESDFNCTTLQLTGHDLDRLEADSLPRAMLRSLKMPNCAGAQALQGVRLGFRLRRPPSLWSGSAPARHPVAVLRHRDRQSRRLGTKETTMSTTAPERRDLHAEITNQLIAAIEADPGKPSLPWRRRAGALHLPVNSLTGNAYSGINVLNLWVVAELRDYATPLWATRQRGCLESAG